MGKLINRSIELVRSYVDPLNPTPIPSLDYNIIYPITLYEAVKKTMDEESTNLEDELNSIYELISKKQDPVSGGMVGSLMVWTNVPGEIGSMEVVKKINDDPTLRSHSKVPSERAVGYKIEVCTRRRQGLFSALYVAESILYQSV